ncbi:unnamed protein product [Cuscuta campestris]|uniref:Replication protein A 70 kDa DNA-binding subunit B/D first OB fold domain-containing protein n=1 Tax=Cuscuta campestris TaxID=132261 RepID=A0A484N0V1_9ASTE|nr:unnamed protein product [Cuscuta campestris]
MDDHQLIPEITPQSRAWTCKVTIIEKLNTRDSFQTPGKKYKALIMQDTAGNKVKGMTYNEDILVIDERLQLHETYLISNAKVSPITNSFGFPDDNYRYLQVDNDPRL